NGIRTRRAQHFADVFGIPGEFQSQTGLPDPTLAPKAPSSYHNTLHMSIARAWSRLPLAKKKAILSSTVSAALDSFIVDVRIQLCATSHRGNIYSSTIDEEIRTLMPSFFEALRVASERDGLEDRSGAAYVHDWTKNKIVEKMGAFKSTIFKIITGSASQPFYVHADVLARSDLLRRLIAGPWKESIDRVIDWSEWESSVVEKFVEWLYTGDYTCPYPTLIEALGAGDVAEEGQKDFSETSSSPRLRLYQMVHETLTSAATKIALAKKQKLPPLKELSWNGKARPTRLTQAEEFDKWSGHDLWASEQLDYGATFSMHAELYIMGRRYMLEELSRMVWERLRAVLQKIGRPVPGSRVIANVMDLVLDTYDRIGDPTGDEDPLKELINTFVALKFTAFQASGMEDWANSDNSTAREFIPGLMSKLMLRAKEWEGGNSTPSVSTAPPSSTGSGTVGFGNSNHRNPMDDTRSLRGRRSRGTISESEPTQLTMGTRGLKVWRYRKRYFSFYNDHDSYPSGLADIEEKKRWYHSGPEIDHTNSADYFRDGRFVWQPPAFVVEELAPSFLAPLNDLSVEWIYTIDLEQEVFSVNNETHYHLANLPGEDHWCFIDDQGCNNLPNDIPAEYLTSLATAEISSDTALSQDD
ncbi:MAG: hypothetical protein Q9192_007630, partial [Flavoplaca navasiana]